MCQGAHELLWDVIGTTGVPAREQEDDVSDEDIVAEAKTVKQDRE